MGYKFSMGPTVLSGTLTQLSGTMDLADAGELSASVKVTAGQVKAVDVFASGLSSGRVAYVGTNGQLKDDSNFTFAADSNTLTVDKIGAFEAAGAIDFSDEVMTNVNIDSGAIDGAVIGANSPQAATVTTLTANGNVQLGDNATEDTITATGRFASDLVPSSDSARALGSSALQWSAIHVDVGHIDQLGAALDANSQVITNVNIDSGAIDGAVIGANSAASGSFTDLIASGDVDLGDNTGDTITATGRFDSDLVPSTDSARALGTSALQWSAIHVDVGHIDQLGSALDANSQIITSVNIDSGAIDGTIIGANSAAAGTFAAIVGSSLDCNGVGDFSDTLTLSKASGNGLVVTADADLNGNVDIAGDLTLSAGADGALRFSVAGSSIKMIDNKGFADGYALVFEEDDNPYLSFDTTNTKEQVQISKKLALSSSTAGPQDLSFGAGTGIEIGGGNLIIESSGDVELFPNSGTGDIQNLGRISGSAGLIIGGAARFDSAVTVKAGQNIDLGLSADTEFDVASDMLYFRDASDSKLKTMALASFLTDIAGSGLSVSGNQLVADGAGAPNSIGDVNATLTEGFNYGSATLSTERTWTLPANPTAGDIVRVKAPASLGGQVLNIKPDSSDTLEDQAAGVGVRLEADGAAINCIAISAGAWKIF